MTLRGLGDAASDHADATGGAEKNRLADEPVNIFSKNCLQTVGGKTFMRVSVGRPYAHFTRCSLREMMRKDMYGCIFQQNGHPC